MTLLASQFCFMTMWVFRSVFYSNLGQVNLWMSYESRQDQAARGTKVKQTHDKLV